jgi:hypothetical protein
MDRQQILKEDSFPWLLRGDLKGESVSEVITTQDQALKTKYATKILQTETESKYRMCQQVDETAENIMSACPILAKKQDIKRHGRVCAQLQLDNEHWYEYVSELAETSCECKVTSLWN